jgi:transposase
VAAEQRPMPDWAVLHRELRRPNVTLSLLWEEYRGGTGAHDGFGSAAWSIYYTMSGDTIRVTTRIWFKRQSRPAGWAEEG